MLFQAGLYFNWLQIEETHTFAVGEMVWTAEAMMSNALGTLMILYIKFLSSAVLFPHQYTILRSRVMSLKVSPATLAILVAIYELFDTERGMLYLS